MQSSTDGPVEASVETLRGIKQKLVLQRAHREENLHPNRPDEDQLKKLDSTVKRNTALIKRLKQVTEENKDALCEEIRKINQSKYVSEAVSAMAEAPLKSGDVTAAVQVCALLHQTYPDFGSGLAPALARLFSPTYKPSADDDKTLPKRRRSAARMLVELLIAGIHQDTALVLGVVRDLIPTPETRREREALTAALLHLTAVARAGREALLGMAPAVSLPMPAEIMQQEGSQLPEDVAAALVELREEQQALDKEVALRWMASDSERAAFMRAFDRTFDAAAAAVVAEHRDLVALESELPEEAAAEYERRRRSFEALHRAASGLAEALGRPLPELVQELTRIGPGDIRLHDPSAGANDPSSALFEDQESRAFYESLPDLRSLVPAVLLGEADAGSKRKSTDGEAAVKKEGGEEGEGSKEAAGAEGAVAAAQGDRGKEEADKEKAADAEPTTPPSAGNPLDALLTKLPVAVSRDLCDEISINFCFVSSGSKAARRRMVRTLCDVPRGGMQLLPFYARVAATLGQVFGDIPQGVVSYLEEEFAALLIRKDQTSLTLEPRLRNMRYFAELVKFRVVGYGTVFSCLKQLLDDFVLHNIEAACALVEAAGRFLLRLPETRSRMENMLEVMNRLKNVKNLDARQAALVDNAYFVAKAPSQAARKKKRPPLQEYIRHLIFERLTDASIVEVLRKLVKLPWAECECYVVRCLLKVVRGRFAHVPLIASLAGGLTQHRDSLGVALVDAVLEDVRTGLEMPGAGMYQKRLADMRLLGELYNYMLLDSRTIFDTLYLLISFGHDRSLEEAARLDPADDFFRIRLVVQLLGSCGGYFSQGNAAARMDRFLTFFQAYCMSKGAIPLDMEFDLQDIFHSMRPKLERFQTLDEARAAVEVLVAKEVAAMQNGLSTIDEEDDDEEQRKGRPGVGGDDDVSASEDASEAGARTPWEDGDDPRGDEHDDEFERELGALLKEYQGKPMVTMAAVAEPAAVASTSGAGGDGEPTIAFKMLMKRGGKEDRTHEIQLPATSSMAMSRQQAAVAEAAERSAIKRLVLTLNKRDEQEELASSTGIPTQLRRPPPRAGEQEQPGRGRGTGGYYSRGGSARR